MGAGFAPPRNPSLAGRSCYNCPPRKSRNTIRAATFAPATPARAAFTILPTPTTFVFDNDFAALKLNTSRERIDIGVDSKGLIIAQGEPGICRVICFSPRHDLTLATMGVDAIELVVRTWMEQFRELGEMASINHVQIFENRGAMMGASNPHPHCQIWASASIPDAPAKELASQTAYRIATNRCLLCDYIELERRLRVRVVAENSRFVALVPFWAVWPFEILLCSRNHLGSMNDFANDDAPQLSAILKQITSTYDKVFGVPFPYSMGFHQSPTDGLDYPECHFHAHFYPPLLRSATIRKFMVGFEMLGTPQRDITAESAAERLRELAGA